ncbi:MAG: hypothetical protein CR972_00545 [Candidatus Moraniibacteriota bacterium]|nr:MAG: hypothetical protein CR972_00545 [Candidatus Moranbacteria bacterium]
MKIPLVHKTNNFFPQIVILLTILVIPFYQLRFFVFNISISILSFFLLLFCTFFYFIFHNTSQKKISKNIFFIFCILFIFSFIPSLFLYPNTHAFGVFIEWIFLPTISGLLLWYYGFKKNSHNFILFCLLLLSLSVSIASLLLFIENFVTYDHRLSAFFLSPNHLAMFIAPFLFTNIAFFIKTSYKIFKVLCVIAIFSCASTLFFTQSFSTIFAICASFFIIFSILIKKKKVFILLTTLLLITLCSLAFLKFDNSNIIFERNSFSSRIMIWNTSLHLIQKNPLFGYEIDNFQTIYLNAQPLYTPYLEWAVPTPHNIFLNLLISGGFFALFSFCTLCAYILYSGYMFYIQNKKPYIIFIYGSFLTILFCGLFDTPFWKNDLSIIFWIITVLIMPTLSQNQVIKKE